MTTYTARRVEIMTGIPYHRIAYAQRLAVIPEPQRHGSTRREYTDADIRAICNYFGVDIPNTIPTPERV